MRGGEVIELSSDLGGGKTTFVRGLARGAGSDDTVASPSFTISREYRAGKLFIHHYDFYRLGEAGLMSQELAEVLDDPQAVVVVEWAHAVNDVLPDDRAVIRISNTGETTRDITIHLSKQTDYLRGRA